MNFPEGKQWFGFQVSGMKPKGRVGFSWCPRFLGLRDQVKLLYLESASSNDRPGNWISGSTFVTTPFLEGIWFFGAQNTFNTTYQVIQTTAKHRMKLRYLGDASGTVTDSETVYRNLHWLPHAFWKGFGFLGLEIP